MTKRAGGAAPDADAGGRGEAAAAVVHRAISSVQLDGQARGAARCGRARARAAAVADLPARAQVVLRITMHCRDNCVMGSLLGLDVDDTLEVTNCFPIPGTVGGGAEGGGGGEGEDDVVTSEYQLDMMKALREVNIDYNQVGWYTPAYLGSHVNPDIVSIQAAYQESIGPHAVVVIYDPLSTAGGSLALRVRACARACGAARRVGGSCRQRRRSASATSLWPHTASTCSPCPVSWARGASRGAFSRRCACVRGGGAAREWATRRRFTFVRARCAGAHPHPQLAAGGGVHARHRAPRRGGLRRGPAGPHVRPVL